MGYLVRALKFLVALVLTAAVVLWFAARRGDRGYIQEEVTIDRSATVVFRWIVSDELLRRWISDVSKLQRSGPTNAPTQANADFRLEELIANQPVAFEIKIVRTVPNQEIDLLVQPPPEPLASYISNANFKLFPDGDYTRLVFTSQTNYFSLNDRIFEPILTYATRRKLRDDLARLKVMVEAEAVAPPEVRGRSKGQ